MQQEFAHLPVQMEKAIVSVVLQNHYAQMYKRAQLELVPRLMLVQLQFQIIVYVVQLQLLRLLALVRLIALITQLL